jgi:protein gp37
MGKKSHIEWTDNTFNPWWGCLKVGPGCDRCYAERWAKRLRLNVWGPYPTPRKMQSEDYWEQPLRWDEEAARTDTPQTVFCGSMCDVFEEHPGVVDARAHLWGVIEHTSNLIWLLLTKRPENIERMIPFQWVLEGIPANVWFGISAENQHEFDTRYPILESFATCYYPGGTFLSLEPLLGPIDLEGWLEEIDVGDEDHSRWTRPPDWVIAGGESGPGARPMDLDWARDIRDQCLAADVPFFLKQLGGTRDKRAGDKALLDGQLWREYPKEWKVGA